MFNQATVHAAGFQQVISPSHVGLEGREGRAERGTYNCLRGEMKNGLNFTLIDRSFEHPEVFETALHRLYARDVATSVKFAARVRISDQGHDFSPDGQ